MVSRKLQLVDVGLQTEIGQCVWAMSPNLSFMKNRREMVNICGFSPIGVTMDSPPKKIPDDKAMPEYQMFPVGIWHMLATVMLMVFCIAITLMSVSELVSSWLSERTLIYLEFAFLAVMMFVLATPTFLLSRGWSLCHRFLIWHNRFYILLLVVASGMLFVDGHTGMALTGLVGLILAVFASVVYCSRPYLEGVEHYRLIWAHHRSNKHG